MWPFLVYRWNWFLRLQLWITNFQPACKSWLLRFLFSFWFTEIVNKMYSSRESTSSERGNKVLKWSSHYLHVADVFLIFCTLMAGTSCCSCREQTSSIFMQECWYTPSKHAGLQICSPAGNWKTNIIVVFFPPKKEIINQTTLTGMCKCIIRVRKHDRAASMEWAIRRGWLKKKKGSQLLYVKASLYKWFVSRLFLLKSCMQVILLRCCLLESVHWESYFVCKIKV